MTIRPILIISLFLLIISCKSTQKPANVTGDDGMITLKFVQLNDVYEIAPLSGGKYGGMARVAHVVDSIRKGHPNTYLVLAGDFLNPSLLGTVKVDGERLRGKQMIEVMNAMNFDLVTFGNHEFDLDEEDLQKRLNESNFQWLSSNVSKKTEAGNKPFSVARDIGVLPIPSEYNLTVTDTDGTMATLGFYSVCLDSNPRDYVVYDDIYESAQNTYNKLKTNSDLIIGLTHVKVEDDIAIAQMLKDVPLIMGGHEHNNMLVPEGNSVIAKADANAKTIYIHTLTFNKETKETSLDSKLFPIDEKIASKPEVEAIVNRWNAVLESEIKQVIPNPHEVIYYADPPLDGTDSASRGIQTNMGEIITAAMAASYGEEISAAIVNGGSIRIDDMIAGDVTSIDIFRVLPFGGMVLKVDMTGELLKKVLDFGKSKRGTGAYLQRYNIREGSRGSWMIDGQPLETGNRYYTIAISDFLLLGYDIPFLTAENPGILKVYTPKEGEMAYDVRKAVILNLKSNQQ
ncbi:bifunctional metallophosphatase/5'-nucleotidase [Aureitalea sp. L0-47]|uniref:bifunctional metallophosphatase/5'-nucleotidase n=1 Tax=Aureitalea sp. L0-47 TaxID=2816962 RepID=UPI002238C620|nr:bifunctional metallophosphatase/5'-nucleotidase [Aureitalea sp. L0-47]MCW5519135.1 bifunctional metallophosphatase/5'-nucleotidase [Aureitalea sp. L0-47]